MENNGDVSRDFVDVLKMFSPGTALRSALDDLLRARMGALIIFDHPDLRQLFEGGFLIKAKFSPQKLVELCKMDGAVILSDDGKKILNANVMVHPDQNVFSRETGTRHKSAERTARQIKTITVAVSERKNKISVYYCDERHELQNASIISSKASEVLQVLEKQRDLLNDLIRDFNVLEINNLVTIKDVCSVLRRIEITKRVADLIRRYLVELGKEGLILSMRLRELIGEVPRLEEQIIEDYFDEDVNNISRVINSFSFDSLLDPNVIYDYLSNEVKDKFVSPKGVRLLKKIGLEEKYIALLISRFDCLNKIVRAGDDILEPIFDSQEDFENFKTSLTELKQNVFLKKDF